MRLIFAIAGDERKMRPGLVLILLLVSLLSAGAAERLIAQGHHLVSRVKSNAVAYAPAEPPKGKRKRGRPRRYGKKIKLKSLLSDPGIRDS
jgi:hypothetical protein